jgi:hypothetical protein
MSRRLLTSALLLLAAAACSQTAEITSPATPVHPMHTDAAGDSTKRGPGTFGGGN